MAHQRRLYPIPSRLKGAFPRPADDSRKTAILPVQRFRLADRLRQLIARLSQPPGCRRWEAVGEIQKHILPLETPEWGTI